jgi:hypothetical protein
VSLSSETDYAGAPTNAKGTKVVNGHFGDQLAWLEADLARVNRSKTPWIIAGKTDMYLYSRSIVFYRNRSISVSKYYLIVDIETLIFIDMNKAQH